MEEKQVEHVRQALENAVELEVASRVVAGKTVQYRLLLTQAQEFWLEANDREESVAALLGKDLRRAIGYFDRIVEGGATPCCIGEIVADLLWRDTMA